MVLGEYSILNGTLEAIAFLSLSINKQLYTAAPILNSVSKCTRSHISMSFYTNMHDAIVMSLWWQLWCHDIHGCNDSMVSNNDCNEVAMYMHDQTKCTFYQSIWQLIIIKPFRRPFSESWESVFQDVSDNPEYKMFWYTCSRNPV